MELWSVNYSHREEETRRVVNPLLTEPLLQNCSLNKLNCPSADCLFHNLICIQCSCSFRYLWLPIIQLNDLDIKERQEQVRCPNIEEFLIYLGNHKESLNGM